MLHNSLNSKWKIARFGFMALLLMLAVVLAGRIVSVLIMSKSQADFFLSDAAQDISKPIFFFAFSLLLFALIKWDLWHRIRLALQSKVMSNILLVVAAVLFTIILFELVMRPFSVVFSAAHSSRNQFGEGGNKADFIKDDMLGFMPAMGPTANHNEYGVRHNNYPLAKPEGWRRTLFMGDSIIAYGLTQKALQGLLENKPIEFWDAGVYGYSTAQEVMFFKRFNRPVKPDLVVLGFCLNDFDGTPVVLRNSDGGNVVVSPYLGQEHYNAWLFKNSVLYRLYLSAKASMTGRAGLADDVKKYLTELKTISQEDGFTLKVIVYPILQAEADWSTRYVQQHAQIIEILKELEIVHYDLKPLLNETIKNHKVSWTQMTEEDYFHPSQNFSWVIAKHLLEKGLLQEEMQIIEQQRALAEAKRLENEKRLQEEQEQEQQKAKEALKKAEEAKTAPKAVNKAVVKPVVKPAARSGAKPAPRTVHR